MPRRRRTRGLTRRSARRKRGSLLQATGSLIVWALVLAAALLAVASCMHI